MKILIAGGAGEVGKHLVQDLTDQGHRVRVLDRAEKTKGLRDAIRGDLSDPALVSAAVEGVDAIVNLAWSFAEDPQVIFGEDIRGHVNLLEAACTHKVSRFIYTSTATVYGKAVHHPVTEAHPCLIAEARKPLYALGKYTAEELCRHYFKTRGLPTTIFRFWWAFGATIGGSNLRDLDQKSHTESAPGDGAGRGRRISHHGGSGTGDPAGGIETRRGRPDIQRRQPFFVVERDRGYHHRPDGFDGLSSNPYLQRHWRGAAFLNEVWDLDWSKARQEIGYEPAGSVEAMKASFMEALKSCVAQVRSEENLK